MRYNCIGHKFRKFIYDKLNESLLALVINVLPSYKFSIHAQNGFFLLTDRYLSFYISRAHRIFKYKLGLRNRLEEITNKYFLRMIEFSDEDLIIDVGANIGEVALALRNIVAPGLNVLFISVEPDPIEFSCLKLNLKVSDLAYQNFVSNKNGEAEAIFNNISGDTHLVQNLEKIEIGAIENFSKIRTTTLDNLVLNKIKLKNVKLLKIEVEGMEPEVLLGAQQILQRTEYVAIDCGPERNGMDTFLECKLIMEANGFELAKSHGQHAQLFQRIGYIFHPQVGRA